MLDAAGAFDSRECYKDDYSPPGIEYCDPEDIIRLYSLENINAISWGGWTKNQWNKALWLAQLTWIEQFIFESILNKKYSLVGIRAYWPTLTKTGVEKIFNRASDKFARALCNIEGTPIDPQVFKCWCEDVYHRCIYHRPSHARVVGAKRRRDKEEWG